MKELKMGKVLFKLVALFIGLNTLLNATAPTQENVTKLYVATFNRAPDAAGLNYWVNDAGLSLEGIAESFFDQPETQETYPTSSTNQEFVIAVYDNLFNRAPDQAGLDYWVNELESKRIEKSVFILAIINGAQDTNKSQDATILSNKSSVGIYFTQTGLDDTEEAKNIMSDITADFSTVNAAFTTILNNPNITISFTLDDSNSDTCTEDWQTIKDDRCVLKTCEADGYECPTCPSDKELIYFNNGYGYCAPIPFSEKTCGTIASTYTGRTYSNSSLSLSQSSIATVIILHGKNGSPEASFLQTLAIELKHKGYDVLLPYMPWSGFRWDGAYCNALSYLNDLISKHKIRGKDVILLGHSLGAPVALAYAAREDLIKPKATVAVAPGHFIHQSSLLASYHAESIELANTMISSNQSTEYASFETWNAEVVNITTTPEIYLSFHDTALFPNITSSISQTTNKVLWLAGVDDPLTSAVKSLGIYSTLQSNANYTYKEIPGTHISVVNNVVDELHSWYNGL